MSFFVFNIRTPIAVGEGQRFFAKVRQCGVDPGAGEEFLPESRGLEVSPQRASLRRPPRGRIR